MNIEYILTIFDSLKELLSSNQTRFIPVNKWILLDKRVNCFYPRNNINFIVFFVSSEILKLKFFEFRADKNNTQGLQWGKTISWWDWKDHVLSCFCMGCSAFFSLVSLYTVMYWPNQISYFFVSLTHPKRYT